MTKPMTLERRLLNRAIRLGLTVADWGKVTPHFEGRGGHRYEGYASYHLRLRLDEPDIEVCIYCLCPKNYERKTP